MLVLNWYRSDKRQQTESWRTRSCYPILPLIKQGWLNITISCSHFRSGECRHYEWTALCCFFSVENASWRAVLLYRWSLVLSRWRIAWYEQKASRASRFLFLKIRGSYNLPWLVVPNTWLSWSFCSHEIPLFLKSLGLRLIGYKSSGRIEFRCISSDFRIFVVIGIGWEYDMKQIDRIRKFRMPWTSGFPT